MEGKSPSLHRKQDKDLVNALLVLMQPNRHRKEEFCTMWEKTWKIYKSFEADDMDRWAQTVDLCKKIENFVEEYKTLFQHEIPDGDGKEEFSALCQEIGEIYKNLEARTRNRWAQNIILWKKSCDLLEKCKQVFQEEEPDHNYKEIFSSWWENIQEIHKNKVACHMDWKVNDKHFVKISDYLKGVEALGHRRVPQVVQKN